MSAYYPPARGEPVHPVDPPTSVLPLDSTPTEAVPVVVPERDRIDSLVDSTLIRSRSAAGQAQEWLRDTDHKLLVLIAAVAAVFLLLVAAGG